ncbi:MAG: RidA family protein, partial [Hyphomicrobium sp.]
AKGAVIAGRLSAEPGPGLLDIEHGQAAARAAALSLMAQVKGAIGDLNRIARVLRITGFVAATSDFTDHPMVMNGASDLLVAVFGDCGRHTRSAVGVASLPLGAAVEIDAIFEVAPPHA